MGRKAEGREAGAAAVPAVRRHQSLWQPPWQSQCPSHMHQRAKGWGQSASMHPRHVVPSISSQAAMLRAPADVLLPTAVHDAMPAAVRGLPTAYGARLTPGRKPTCSVCVCVCEGSTSKGLFICLLGTKGETEMAEGGNAEMPGGRCSDLSLHWDMATESAWHLCCEAAWARVPEAIQEGPGAWGDGCRGRRAQAARAGLKGQQLPDIGCIEAKTGSNPAKQT